MGTSITGTAQAQAGGGAAATRFPRAAARLRDSAMGAHATLVALGVAAALLTLLVDLDLKTPGHAILRCVVPLALGVAVAPRRGAGAVMAGAAAATAVIHGSFSEPRGVGSMTSLILAGPFLEFAVRRAGSGRGVYLGIALAGLAANLCAFAVRFAAKVGGGDGGGPLATWWPRALPSYAICGAAAGLVSAALWFRFAASADAEDAHDAQDARRS